MFLRLLGMIFFLSSRRAPALASVFPVILGLKLTHFVEYALLSALWLWGFLRGSVLPRPAAYAWTITIVLLWGISDEYHQSFTPGRTPLVADVLTDTFGAVVFILFHRRFSPRRWMSALRFPPERVASSPVGRRGPSLETDRSG